MFDEDRYAFSESSTDFRDMMEQHFYGFSLFGNQVTYELFGFEIDQLSGNLRIMSDFMKQTPKPKSQNELYSF